MEDDEHLGDVFAKLFAIDVLSIIGVSSWLHVRFIYSESDISRVFTRKLC